MTQQLTD